MDNAKEKTSSLLPSADGKEIGIGTGVKLRLHYRKGNPAQKLIWLLIALLFSFGTMTDLLGMPEAVRYSLDILWLLLLALLLRFAAEAAWQQLGWAVCWVISFFLLTAAVKLVRQGSWFTWLWGVRNNFRGYVLFFAGAYLSKQFVPLCVMAFLASFANCAGSDK